MARNSSSPNRSLFCGLPSTCNVTTSALSSSSRESHGARIAARQHVSAVIEDDTHAHGLGQIGKLRADLSVSHNAECQPAHLVSTRCRLVPLAAMHLG